MQKLVTDEAIRSSEKEWINKNGVHSSLILMEKAGEGLANQLEQFIEPYLFVCGKGNNAGDGFVAGRKLLEKSKKVLMIMTCDESDLSQDALFNFLKIKSNIIFKKISINNYKDLMEYLSQANTVIDCLLGTGAKGEPSDFYKQIIDSINNSHKQIIACDIPTGIDPNNGGVSSSTIKANMTVTFAVSKAGLYIFPAKEYCGEIKIIDIGLPEINSNLFLMDDFFAKETIPERKQNTNKGSFGKTLLVSGSKDFPGAALLASKGASSIGSGLTALSSEESVFKEITSAIPEVTHVEFSFNSIVNESKKSNVIVIGPGLGIKNEAKKLVLDLLSKVNIPIVLDADGLNSLEGNKDFLKCIKNDFVITPHPKEFARLLGKSVDEVLKNKLSLSREFAKEYNCTVVLKGAGTIISSTDGNTYISPFANSALAKGGTGDVLSGFIGGLIAQGLSITKSACLGVYLHGKSAEIISKEKTEYSLLPQDLITYLPQTIKSIL